MVLFNVILKHFFLFEVATADYLYTYFSVLCNYNLHIIIYIGYYPLFIYDYFFKLNDMCYFICFNILYTLFML